MRFSGWDRVATFACGSQLAVLPWDYTQPVPGMYTTLCTYEPATGAWFTCMDQVIRQHTTDYDRLLKDTVGWVNLVCTKAGGHLKHYTLESIQSSLANATDYIIDLPSDPVKLNRPVVLEYKSRERIVDAVHAEFANLDNSNDSVYWIYGYFAIILISLIILRVPSVRSRVIKSRWVNKLRGKLELPTMWKTEHHSAHASWAMGGLFPTSVEASLIVGFFIAHTIALFYNYSVDLREVMETVFLQKLQALGNRSGIVSFGLLPLLIVFSSRSNLLPYLTDLRYTTFLVLHRWIGRMIVLDAIIHSIAFYYHEYLTGALPAIASQSWWKLGIWATALSIVVTVLAAGFLRRRWYELFLYTHILLAAAFFYLSWEHVRKFGWTYWIWISCGIWLAERIHRLYKLARNGVIYADITAANPNILVLSIPKPAGWKDHPAQFGFVHFLIPSVFWQSHPFTLSDEGDKLLLVMLVKDGATRSLQRAVLQRASGDGLKRAQIPILVEGPCGTSPDLHRFERIVLVSGGSGIPGPLSVARSLAKRNDWNGAIHLVTVAREIDVLKAYEHQLDEVKKSGRVDMQLHYTGWEDTDSFSIPLKKARPDVAKIVSNWIAGSESLAVVCCGPPSLNDKVRNIVAEMVEASSGVDIEYFEEFQVW